MQLFLSHATRDVDLVHKVSDRLKTVGVSVYLAEHDGHAGENVHDKISEAINRSDVVVVLLTGAGSASNYVHQEIGWAKSKGKLIIPVVTAQAAQGGLGMLEGIEYIPVEEDDTTAALDQLGARISSVVQQRQNHDTMVAAGVALVAIGAILLVLTE